MCVIWVPAKVFANVYERKELLVWKKNVERCAALVSSCLCRPLHYIEAADGDVRFRLQLAWVCWLFGWQQRRVTPDRTPKCMSHRFCVAGACISRSRR